MAAVGEAEVADSVAEEEVTLVEATAVEAAVISVVEEEWIEGVEEDLGMRHSC